MYLHADRVMLAKSFKRILERGWISSKGVLQGMLFGCFLGFLIRSFF